MPHVVQSGESWCDLPFVRWFMHRHVALPVHHGLLSAPRVLDHPATDPDDEAGYCGLCSALVWTDRRLRHFMAMRPWVPLLCCVCCTVSRDILAQAVPDMELLRRDVPDLAARGDFN